MKLIAWPNFALAVITFMAISFNAQHPKAKLNAKIGGMDNHEEKNKCQHKGIGLLSGCWKTGLTKNFARYLEAMGLSPMLAMNIARNKKGSIGIAFDHDNPQITTIIARLMHDDVMDAKVAMNYTNVKADNDTIYDIPMNMLTGNTMATGVIFGKSEHALTLYAVGGSVWKSPRLFSVEWSLSDNSTSNMIEKWVHIPTQTEAISNFYKVENADEDHYCDLLAPVIPFRRVPFPTQC